MAHKTTGTKNQDKISDPQMNENPDDKGYAKKEKEIKSGSVSEPHRRQENLQNRGFEEDQPKNPVRSTGSLNADQQEDKYRQPGDEFAEGDDKISS